MRTFLLHQAEGFSECGVSLSIGYDVRPRPRLGWAARFAPGWGAPAVAGGALLHQGTMGGVVPGRLDAGWRVDPEIGYGLRAGARFVARPRRVCSARTISASTGSVTASAFSIVTRWASTSASTCSARCAPAPAMPLPALLVQGRVTW